MTPEAIKDMIESSLPGTEAHVDGDGSHFIARVISDDFEGVTVVKQHQMVYGALGDSMAGAIHALSIQTYTRAAWEKVRNLQVM